MKDIYIITSYFPPETGAASNRIFQLAEGLKKKHYKVSVITPLPNYPSGKIFQEYKGKFQLSSEENGILIHRLWIFASNSKNKLLRLTAMLSYSFSLIWFFFWHKIPNKVIIQSPPLLVAFTCVFFLKSKSRKLILNVSDLWPIAGLELGAFKKNFSYSLLEKIERFNYKNSDLILGQSNEILTHVSSIFPKKQTFLYRNYPDFSLNENMSIHSNNKKIKIVYAGLLGVAQGILKLCQSLDYSGYELHIYGKGAEQKKIEDFISENPRLPIYYYGEVSREELHKKLINFDLTIIPLLNRIYGSVPSKIFEYAKLGLPIIYFGGGEGEDIVNKFNLGWVATAGDYSNLNIILSTINKTELDINTRRRIRKTSLENFNFDLQLEELMIKL